MTSPSLSDLPPDLINDISTHLSTYIDYLRFRATSHHILLSTSSTPTHLPIQLPFLLLPHSHPSATSSTLFCRAFFDLSFNKFHFIPFLNPSLNKSCCGSSHGWLVMLDEYPSITLINAITTKRVILPSVDTFPNVTSLDFSNVGREYTIVDKSGMVYTSSLWNMRDMFIKKIVLSGSPVNDDEFVAVAILNQGGELAYCRKGDEEWCIVNDVEGCEDVVYFNGLFYAVNKVGCVTVCDMRKNVPKVSVIKTAQVNGGDMHYLIGFDEGLLFVSRYLDMVYDEELDHPDVMYKTIGFEVSRMDWGLRVWDKTSMGNKVLFLGENSSLCLVASEYVGCKENCIYFTDDYSASNGDGYWGDFDLGVYSLVDGTIEPLVSCPRNSRTGFRWPPPIWVTPNPL